MPQINCYLPIKLRIVGELSEAHIEQLGQTLVRTLQERLAFAERTIVARYNLASLSGETEVREAYDPGREEAEAGRYQVPSYLHHGRPTSIALQTRGRPWIIRKVINFHARIGAFLDFVESLRTDRNLESKVLYISQYAELRWVSLWLVQVNQDYALQELEEVLFKRALELSRVRNNQVLAYGLGTTETMRQSLIELDEDNQVSKEIPSFVTRNTGRVFGSGEYLDIMAGGWLLFASMVLPKIELLDVGTPGIEVQIALKLHDLDFLVPPVLFERNFHIPWREYIHELGDTPVTLRLQPVRVVKRVDRLALEYLMEQMVLQNLRNERGTLSDFDAYYGRLFVLNNSALEKFPPSARSRAEALTDDVTRRLDEITVAGELAPNWKAVFAYAVFPVDQESIGAARYHPEARRLVLLLLAQLRGDEDDRAWQNGLLAFLRDNLGANPPPARLEGGSIIEYVLVELETRGEFTHLFDKVEASGHFGLHHLLVQLALSTRYATHPRVRQSYERLNRRYNADWEHTYRINEQEIWLKNRADQVVRRGDIIAVAVANSIYSVERKEKRFKEASLPKLRKALEKEGQELLKRILLGQDQREYSDEEFALAAFDEVRKHPEPYGISDSDFETVTVERSARLLGLEVRVEAALERIYVTYELVERVNGRPWSTAETVPNSRCTQFIGSYHGVVGEGFEQMLWFWEYNKAAAVILYFTIAVSALAVIAMAWEVGLVAGAVELAGGWGAVGLSIGISELFFAYRIIFKGEEFTWGGFFVAALDGYLGALFFRGAGVLARGFFGRSITTVSFREGLLRWIGVQIFKGVVGGGGSGAAMRFTHDVYLVATGRGKWSSPAEYAKSIGWGAALGVGMEFAGPLVLEPVLGKLAGGAVDVARLLRANGISAARWQAWSIQALLKIRQNLNELLESAPARAANIREGFRLLYEQIGEAYASLGGALRGRVQLSVFRQLLEFSGAELSSSAAKGLEKFLQGAASHLDEDMALSVVKRIVASGGRVKNFFETLNLLDENAVSRLIGRGELEGWLLVFERNIELTPEVRAGLERLYGTDLSRQTKSELLRLPAVDTVPNLLGFLGRLGQGTVNDLAREGYLSPLARAPRVLQFVTQPENLEALRRIVQGATGGPTLDVVIAALERTLEKNPGLNARDIEAGVIRSRTPVYSGGGGSYEATWPGSPGAKAHFIVYPDGSVRLSWLVRGELPKRSGGAMVASALRAVGASKPPRILLSEVVNEPTVQALRQGKDFANTVLGETLAATAEELGGRIVKTEISPTIESVSRRGRGLRYPRGVSRRTFRWKYEVSLTLEY